MEDSTWLIEPIKILVLLLLLPSLVLLSSCWSSWLFFSHYLICLIFLSSRLALSIRYHRLYANGSYWLLGFGEQRPSGSKHASPTARSRWLLQMLGALGSSGVRTGTKFCWHCSYSLEALSFGLVVIFVITMQKTLNHTILLPRSMSLALLRALDAVLPMAEWMLVDKMKMRRMAIKARSCWWRIGCYACLCLHFRIISLYVPIPHMTSVT